MTPLGENVLIFRDKAGEKTPGGLYIPDGAKEKPCEGLVVAVGSGRTLKDGTRQPLEVQPGDRVIFTKYSGVEISLTNQTSGFDHILVNEKDILAIKK